MEQTGKGSKSNMQYLIVEIHAETIRELHSPGTTVTAGMDRSAVPKVTPI